MSASLKEMNDNYRVVSEKLELIQVQKSQFRAKLTNIQAQ